MRNQRAWSVPVVLLAGALTALVACTAEPIGAGPTPTVSQTEAFALPGGPQFPLVSSHGGVVTTKGDDWSLPSWVLPVSNSGFFSEVADPTVDVAVHSIDLSWRQLAPTSDGPLDTTSSGSAQGMDFPSLDDQLAEPGPYWLRVFASGTQWAPAWVRSKCHVAPVGRDYDGQTHLPIWNTCVWSALMRTYRQLFVDEGLAADPRLRFVYVPGAFTWDEFDYDVISQAFRHGEVAQGEYLRWYDTMLSDLVDLFGAYSDKLVFTGEDYPWGPFGRADDLLATRAVAAGMGIRTGITEVSNFHLSETPAYGSRVLPNGHLAIDDTLPIHNGLRVIATENECYNDCGFTTNDLGYVIVASNLKALQLRVNWMYVVPGPSALDLYPEHWDWVRLELGQQVATSPDAWAALRDAQDTFWRWPDPPFGSHGRSWASRPWVRNLERWLVQVDVKPDGVARRSTADIHRGELTRENGVAYEGLATDVGAGQRSLYFDLDDRFAATGSVLIKVTWLDRGRGTWRIAAGVAGDIVSPLVARHNTGDWVTSTVQLDASALRNGLSEATDFALRVEKGADLDVRFVRVVRLERPAE
jgi:hypothetical protein